MPLNAQNSFNFLSELGLQRFKCKTCGEYFWATKRRDTCGEFPCSPYTFIDGEGQIFEVRHIREKFKEFFNKRGHEIIEPYPTVARWRTDLYLTIASIIDFQPYVTDGIVEPPANPLVVVQPCIRLEDIDKVGLTLGRHLSIFEMGGHHAFNREEDWIYWKKETVQFCHEFTTECMGIPEEKVTYKESFWEGGGNAGPSVECLVDGLELSTLVFMEFKAVGDGYIKMPIKVVDTGYGMERFSWYMSSTPSAFEAIYPSILDKLLENLNIPYEGKIFNKLILNLNSERDLPRALSKMNTDERDYLTKIFSIFSILDHTKCFTFMVCDGALPSNSGVGYLSRLVIRRALRHLRRVRGEIPISEIIKWQIDYWSRDFEKLGKARKAILEMAEIEAHKYETLLSKSLKIVGKYIGGKKTVDVQSAVTLYDSHGIPLEVVEEYARKHGIAVPDGFEEQFYKELVKRHEQIEEVKEEETVSLDVKRYPETYKLYYEKPYERKFKAKILACFNNGKIILLDRTLFYPEGGGQPYDKGRLLINGEEYRVEKVIDVENRVLHYLDKPIKADAVNVIGEIDWDRRYALMRAHTGTHILLGALIRVLGLHVWQAGAQKSTMISRLDVTHFKVPTREQIITIENEANKIIKEGRKVRVHIMPRTLAEKKWGVKIYQGGVVPYKKLRIVEIEDWDSEACGGLHCSSTSEVGALKITNVTKIQEGVIRFEFCTLDGLLQYSRDLEEKLYKIASILSTSREDTVRKVATLVNRAKSLDTAVDKLLNVVAKSLSPENPLSQKVGDFYLVELDLEGLEEHHINKLGRLSTSMYENLVLAVKTGNIVRIMTGKEFAKLGFNVGEIIREIISKVKECRGGGSKTFGLVKCSSSKNVEEFINRFKELISSRC